MVQLAGSVAATAMGGVCLCVDFTAVVRIAIAVGIAWGAAVGEESELVWKTLAAETSCQQAPRAKGMLLPASWWPRAAQLTHMPTSAYLPNRLPPGSCPTGTQSLHWPACNAGCSRRSAWCLLLYRSRIRRSNQRQERGCSCRSHPCSHTGRQCTPSWHRTRCCKRHSGWCWSSSRSHNRGWCHRSCPSLQAGEWAGGQVCKKV